MKFFVDRDTTRKENKINNIALLDTTGIVFVGVYLLSLLIIGVAGRLARKEDSLADFYLSGRGMGLFVLFLTLYATQYSGNTLIGMAGKSYRQGYVFIVSVTFMMSVIGAYMIYAPKLHRLSKKHKIYYSWRLGTTSIWISGFDNILLPLCVL